MAWPASALLLLVLCWMLAPRISGMGGYDTYYFLLHARDLAGGMDEGLQARYFYFPGAYHFWRLVLSISDGSFAACQMAFALVGLANAGLVILVAGAARCSPAVAALAGAGYLAIGQRLEFEAITTEPLVTAPALLGLLGWVAAERGGRSRLGLATLGAGLGLAVFAKQQGVLLMAGLLGALTVVRDAQGLARAARGAAGALAAALAVFSSAMWLDGGGMPALQLALETALRYETHGAWLDNLRPVWHRAPLAALLCLALIVGISLEVQARRERRRGASLHLALLGICAFGAAATLLQFGKRGYAHYGLLTLPFALLAAAAAVSALRERLSAIIERHASLSNSLGIAAWAILGFSMLHAVTDWARRDPLKPVQHDAYVAVCATLDRGERLLLLPSRENALHWACGTHAAGTAWGYSYNFHETPEGYVEELRKPDLRQVFVFRPAGSKSYEANVLSGERWQPFYAALRERGFVRAADFTQGTVYRRP